MNDTQRTRLSKFMALLLRHEADKHGLVLDPEGFVPVDELLAVMHRKREWEWVRAGDLEDVIATQEKRRYEIVEGDIRAIYGHSLETSVTYTAITPPDTLLHGTARRFTDAILRDGLRPMSRQYVHLTDEPALALLTGKRRDPRPAIVRIDAARAHAAGVAFYKADNGVFLAKYIPAEYLSLAD